LAKRVGDNDKAPIDSAGSNHPGRGLPAVIKLIEGETEMKNLVNRFVREEEGQDLIEYSLLAALIAVASVLAMQTLAGKINDIFTAIGTALDNAV
jgi:pilus assembly protein Flp/PilA